MKSRKLMASIMAVSFCLSMAGCGSTTTNPESKIDSMPAEDVEAALESKLENTPEEDLEKEFEQAANELEQMEGEQAAATEAATEEIVYEPSDEIMNAEFSSGLIQIGNDIFRNGGYYTVDQIIQEYGDRYDMSEINPDGFQSPGHSSYTMTSKTDPHLHVTFGVYGNTDDPDAVKVRIGDCVVTEFVPGGGKIAWYPKGIRDYDGENYDCFALEKILEESGFKKVTFDLAEFDYYQKYGLYWESSSFGDEFYEWREMATEANLFGVCPLYDYKSFYDMESTKVTGSSCQISATKNDNLEEFSKLD